MASKRGPESFMKRQRERQKQQEQLAKKVRRQARNTTKKEAKDSDQPLPAQTWDDPFRFAEATARPRKTP
jgi:hypothetical protein